MCSKREAHTALVVLVYQILGPLFRVGGVIKSSPVSVPFWFWCFDLLLCKASPDLLFFGPCILLSPEPCGISIGKHL